MGLVISIAVSFILGLVLTYLVGFKEDVAENEMTDSMETSDLAQESLKLGCPVKGNVIPVSSVKDQVFASEMMGPGIGILPLDGCVYAPFDAVAEVVFPTGHAIGFRTEMGLEALLHIGIDTVKLEGKGFTTHIKQGDAVKRGQLLAEFDLDFIRREGYDPTVILIITDMGSYGGLDMVSGMTDANTAAITVKKQEVL